MSVPFSTFTPRHCSGDMYAGVPITMPVCVRCPSSTSPISYAKLLDFGIAKLMGDGDEGERTQTGIVMGTPAYMSPEQCRGVNVEKGTDIYALGMILYEMFAGRLPFQGSFAELITAHLMTAPDPPSRHRPLPRALEQLIIRCIDKDPVQRPQSAEALGKALDA